MVLVLYKHLVIFEGRKPIMCPGYEARLGAGAAIVRGSMGGRDIVGTLGL